MSAPLSISDILERAGGVAVVAAASDGAVSRWAVYKWITKGIPDQHWPLIIRLAGVTADQLLKANIAVREAA